MCVVTPFFSVHFCHEVYVLIFSCSWRAVMDVVSNVP